MQIEVKDVAYCLLWGNLELAFAYEVEEKSNYGKIGIKNIG